jgi:tetratricopeptide (TPR) repeat protein
MSAVDKSFHDAVAALKSGRAADAERLFRKVLDRKPSHVAALNLITVALMTLGRFAEAEPFIVRALKLAPNSDVSLYNYGLIAKRLNKPELAFAQFSKALDINSAVADTWNNRGTVLNQLRRYQEALSDFDRAILLKPNAAEVHANRGKSLNLLQRHDEALAAYDKAVALTPNLPEAWLGQANVLRELQRYDDALACYDKVLALRAGFAAALTGRGFVFLDTQRFDEALQAYDAALATEPTLTDAWLGRGHALYGLKQYENALMSYRRAQELKPDLAPAALGAGVTLAALSRPIEALDAFNAALRHDPGLAEAWLGGGNALYQAARYEHALQAFDRALSLQPDLEGALIGRGNVLTIEARYEEALATYDKVLAQRLSSRALIGRGNVLSRLHQDADALACYDQAIALGEDVAEACFSKSLVKLAHADYAEGWSLYEYRLIAPSLFAEDRRFAQPRWRGDQSLGGKTLLVHCEQGFGDTIQFARYLRLLEALNCRVVFEVQKPLFGLIRDAGLVADVVAKGDPLPPFDLHCPLLSLPLAFETRAETIPASIPYLVADRAKAAAWKERLADARPRIGVVWSGNPEFRYNGQRRIGLEKLLPLMSGRERWLSLQKDMNEDDRALMRSCADLEDLSPALTDFSETAAVMSQLDLVVTSDTSVAHLAGALGLPVWILLAFHADFRWLRDRDDNPWYPTARLFRQKRIGDWDEVAARVAQALSSRADESQ